MTARLRASALVLSLVVGLAGLTGPAGAAALGQKGNKLLGKRNPAKGTPVRIGFITDDKTAATDNTLETPVAEAAAAWINEYRNGIAGRPIDLVRCVSSGDPAKSTDCANEMVRQNVAAVVVGSMQHAQNIWKPLDAAGIPLFAFAFGNPDLLADPDSTFVFSASSQGIVNLVVGAAKEARPKAKKLTVVAIDVPPATQPWRPGGTAAAAVEAAGLDLELVPVAPGTADMTPQMQRVVSDNRGGVVFVVGNDTFCIAAFNGLRAAGFEGTLTTVGPCLSDATRTAVPADFLNGIKVQANAPVDKPNDPSMRLYSAVLEKYGAGSVDRSRTTGVSMFQALVGLDVATGQLKGEVTPQSIIEAARAMPWTEVPVTGGLHARCNGKAIPEQPAVCVRGTLIATLGADGRATKYTRVGDTEIPA